MRYSAKSEASRDLGRRQFFAVLATRITLQWRKRSTFYFALAGRDGLSRFLALLTSLKPKKLAQVVAHGLSLVDSMVGPAWPRKEHAGLPPVVRFFDGELLGDLSDPKRCLKLVEQ